MIDLRVAETDDQLEAWRRVRIAIVPNERTDSVEELRQSASDERLLLLAYCDSELAEAIFEEAGLDCRVRRITTAELGRPAPRPAYSVLESERPDAPRLPHWREGLRDCLQRLA